MTPSPRQQDILDVWSADEDTNILISAVAGSGKTSTLMMLLERCPYKTLFLAFNKSIQTEIQEKMTSKGYVQGRAMTIHSLGLMALKYKFPRVQIDNGKGWKMIKVLQERNKKLFKKILWEEVRELSANLLEINDVSRMFLTDDLEEISEHFLVMDKVMTNSTHLFELWEKFLEIRKEFETPNDKGVFTIDFADMIYLPVFLDLYIPIDPYFLMIDECQDLNLCQHKIVDKLLSQGTIRKWIAVGDRNQSIYGFSGAVSSSFDLFLTKAEKVVELPLDVCYRCGSDIVKEANMVYDIMKPGTEHTGTVGKTDDPSTIPPRAMVICRNTKPLFQLYFQLLSLGKACYIKGDDILKGLLRVVKAFDKYTIHGAKREMEYVLASLSEDKSDEGQMKYYIYKQHADNFIKVTENMCQPHDKVSYFIEMVQTIFEQGDEDSIILSTIHKSKGLEADTVYILNEFLIPSRFAKSPEQVRQESNLKYVARTRAKKNLYYLTVQEEENNLQKEYQV